MVERDYLYRHDLVARVLRAVDQGECCNLVGMAGVGKGNLIRHLANPDVISHYFPHMVNETLMVSIDPNLLSSWSSSGIIKGISMEIFNTFRSSHLHDQRVDKEIITAFTSHADGEFILLVRLVSILSKVIKICVIIDEFDGILSESPANLLRNLRGLRDKNKYLFSLIVFTRYPLDVMPVDETQEAFVSLFYHNVIGVPPLDMKDSLNEIDRLSNLYNLEMSNAEKSYVYKLSGGHPGILKALMKSDLSDVQDNFFGKTLQRGGVFNELTKIWNSLSAEEKAFLEVKNQWDRITSEHYSLVIKGILLRNKAEYKIFSPLLDLYISNEVIKSSKPLIIDIKTHTFIYYGKDITGDLTPLEAKALTYLYNRPGEVCTPSEINEGIYDGVSTDDVERTRLLMRRLMKKLYNIHPDLPGILHIHRSKGYRLDIP